SSCRTGTCFSPARKVSKSACAVARFPGGEVRPSAKTFFIPSYLGQKVFSRCGTHLPSFAAKGECTPIEKETFEKSCFIL
ncbi:MAG: hypothetical protein WCU80_09195, partial [Paludibacteraceae bacterium]